MNLLSIFPLLSEGRKLPKQIISDKWEDRSTIHQSDVNLFCWQRSIDAQVDEFLDLLLEEPGLKLQQTVSINTVESDIGKIEAALHCYGGNSKPFLNDVKRLTVDFLAYSASGTGSLHLRCVDNNACTKFHIDNVFSRLICTYYGPGTEFGIGETEIASRGRAPTGMPVLLKGKRWPESTATRLHHRSPEIEGTGQSRFMVVLEGCPDADILPSYDHLYDCETIIR